jgi:hypothetical protein
MSSDTTTRRLRRDGMRSWRIFVSLASYPALAWTLLSALGSACESLLDALDVSEHPSTVAKLPHRPRLGF